MKRKGWYLLAYDITEPRRLRRVYRLLRKRALPVQQSVFLFKGTEGALRRLLDRLAREMDLRTDDLRAWPVDRMGAAWMYGGDEGSLIAPGRESRLARWLRRLVA